MEIRPARPSDAAAIADFNVRLAAESEGLTLNLATVRRGVERALAEDLGARYWLASESDLVIGQLMTTREWSDWQDGWYVWLQSVYVAAEHRGRGVFRSLLKHVHQTAAQEGNVYSIRLYVEEENVTAQETYQKLGFQSTGYHVLERKVGNSKENS